MYIVRDPRLRKILGLSEVGQDRGFAQVLLGTSTRTLALTELPPFALPLKPTCLPEISEACEFSVRPANHIKMGSGVQIFDLMISFFCAMLSSETQDLV